ncbi:hypothetical protein ABT340_05330 [Streptosporangium sp. NPDC000239]|uniref:hypothetical protein n=1 Tax=Streptosporangium sp. NPDC000239 TaxID=3154248 RepID=UPI003325DA49
MAPVASALRLPRALVFATLCLVVSGGGHALAGGRAVPPYTAVLGGIVALCLGYALNGHERGPQVVLPASVGVQVLLHELFSRAAPVPYPVIPLAHGHARPGMTAVHLAAALLTGWWLWRGESALWLMIRVYGARLPILPVLAATWTPAAVPVLVPFVEAVPLPSGWACPVPRRRGPPALPRAG